MKKVIIQLLKFALSSVIAIAVLSVFAIVYDNSPVTVPTNEPFTNSKYQSRQFWSYMKEGFGYGTIDKDGFNNAYLPDDFVPRTDTDILILGSSHIEAAQIPEDKNLVYLLNDKLHSDNSTDNDLMCYSAGVSGSFIVYTTSTCKYAKDSFDGLDYIVFEAGSLDYPDDLIDGYLAGKYDTHYKGPGTLKALAQTIPAARMIYHNFEDLIKNEFANTKSDSKDVATDKAPSYEKMCDAITDNILSAANDCGAKAILLCHSQLTVGEDGKITAPKSEPLDLYKKVCAEKGIILVDMSDSFIEYYNSNLVLPYGFANTTPGKGHLNKTGHSLISDRLYEVISENIGEDK